MRKAANKIKPIEGTRLVILFFIAFLLIYFLSSPAGNTSYDYFTRLADAFLQGKIYLDENPHWLNELIPAGDNKYFVAYPPMPAIIALPFRFLFGSTFPQQWLAHILGAGTVALSVRIAQLLTPKSVKLHYWIGLVIGLSTVLWFLSSVGSSWYYGQVTAAFLLTASIVSALSNKALLSGIFLGAAYLARVHTVFAFPLIAYLVWKEHKNFKQLVFAAMGAIPFALFNFWYNYARFGVIWDKGYMLIPGVLDEPWYQQGILHPSYISRHLGVILTELPRITDRFPYVFPSWSGLALWLTTPVIVFTLFAPIKNRIVQFTVISTLIVSIPIVTHGTAGFSQFGYRFIVDILPLIVILLTLGVTKTKLHKIHWILLCVGILVNLWGILWINKMGWVVV